VTGFPVGMEYVEFDREMPQPTFEKLTSYLNRQRLERETQRVAQAEQRAAAAEVRATVAEQRLSTVETAVLVGAAVLALAIVIYLVLQSGALKIRPATPQLYVT